eukprot:scaffold1.g5661.t1
MDAATVYRDEEDLLGFKIWVAELELVAASARGKAKPEPRQCFQLLQKLVATLDRTPRDEVREYQRRCEDALIDILLKGAPPPVRRLVCDALGKLYSLGDSLPLYSRVSSLQLFLDTREVQQEALRAAERAAAARDGGDGPRLGAAGVARALARAGGAALWPGGLAGFEVVRGLCLAGLEDPSPAERALREVPDRCLALPFVEGVAAGTARATCAGLAQAWACYLAAARAAAPGPAGDPALVDLGLRVVSMLGAACEAAGAAPERPVAGGEGELGLGTGSGERPRAQACVLYVLRVGVIEALGEGGQRALLDRLAAVLGAAPLGAHTPVGVVVLEALALLLELLGEVPTETRAALEPAIGAKVEGPHACLRLQAASALAALAVAEPSSAARLLAASLRALRGAVGRLAAAAAGAAPDRARQAAPATPRGVGNRRLKADMDAAHGWALAVAALVAATTRLRLGVPSSLLSAALEAAEDLVHCRGGGGGDASADAAKQQQQQQQPATAPTQPAAAAPTQPPQQGPVACLQREAGYVLLGALCAALPASPPLRAGLLAGGAGRARLLALFAPGLGPEAAAELDRRYCGNAASLDHVVAMELWWRAAALAALAAYARGVVEPAPRADQAALAEVAAALLRPTLEVVTSHAPLQLRLLQAYEALPGPAAYVGEQQALTNLCVRAVKAAAAGGAPPVVRGALAGRLHRGDEALGPGPPSRDPLEGALLGFAGAPGGPAAHPWQAGLRRGVGYATDEAGGEAEACAGGGGGGGAAAAVPPFPQPLGLGAALLEAHVGLLGGLLAAVAPANQQLIADALLTIGGGAGVKRERDAQRRSAAVAAVAAAALAGVAALGRGGGAAAAALAPRFKALADLALEESGSDPAFQRAAADLYAASAALGPDTAALALVRALCRESAETGVLARRATLALAVGSIARAVGGLGLQAVLPQAEETLVAVAGASDRSIAVWVLQALLLLAEAAGLAFVPHVRRTLDLDLLLSEDGYSQPGLLPCVGRLANAMVAVLGPDYRLGSPAYYACKSVVNDMRALEAAGGARGGASDAVAAALESVLYAQMLVLFAPGAVPAASHLPLLVATLGSRQPALRRAAAATLRHLAERDAHAVLEEEGRGGTIVRPLFAALDAETDPGIASQLSAALRTLLVAGAPAQPSRWLALCSEVALAAAPGGGGSVGAAGAPGARGRGSSALEGGREGEEEGEEEEEAEAEEERAGGSRPAARPGSGSASGAAAAAPAGAAPTGAAPGLSPRLRTRLFAARLLLQLPGVVCAADPRHACPVPDPAAGEGGAPAEAAAASSIRSSGGDWLVDRLQQLVTTGFRMASGQLEALRPMGLRLLREVVRRFGDAPDPLLEGQRLLEQYQAQVVSALRASLSAGAAPTLSAAGAALAAAFLEKGLAGGDAAVLERLMSLLAAPLAQWGQPQPQPPPPAAPPQPQGAGDELAAAAAAQQQPQLAYAEWVYVRERVALLEAHAHCTLLAAEAGGPRQQGGADEATRRVVLRAQAPHLPLLMEAWLGLLQDYAVLTFQPPEVQLAYRPRLCTLAAGAGGGESGGDSTPGAGVAILASNSGYLDRAWGVSLGAASCALAQRQAVAAGGGGGDPAAREQHAALLDMCQLALCAAAGGEGAAAARGAGGGLQLGPLLTALEALRRLTGPPLEGWVPAAQSQELASLLHQLLRQALLPAAEAEVAAGGGGAPRLPRLLAAAEAAAAVLRTLAGGAAGAEGLQAECLQEAVEACLELAALAPSSPEAERAAGAALAAMVARLRAAAGAAASPGEFAAALQRVLLLGLRLVGGADAGAPAASAAAGAGLLADVAALGMVADGSGAVLAAAAASLCQQAEADAQAAAAAGDGGSAAAEHLGLLLRSVLALGAGLAAAAEGRQAGAAAAAGAAAVPRQAPVAAAAPAAIADDDWEDDPFADTDSVPPSPSEGAVASAGEQVPAPAAGGEGSSEGDAALREAGKEQALREAGAAEQAGSLGEAGQEQEGEHRANSVAVETPAAAEAAGEQGPEEAGLRLCLSTLEQCSQSGSLPVQLQAAQALRSHLQHQHQQQQAAGAPASARARWGLECAGAVLPGASAGAHGLLQSGGQLSQPGVALVTEALKAGLLAVTLAGAASEPSSAAQQAALLRVMVPLLVEGAAPAGPKAPAVADLALALLTHLASGLTAPAFKGAVAELPAGAKQRLAGALQQGGGAAAAPAPGGLAPPPAAAAAGGRPAIQLRMFAAPPPAPKPSF